MKLLCGTPAWQNHTDIHGYSFSVLDDQMLNSRVLGLQRSHLLNKLGGDKTVTKSIPRVLSQMGSFTQKQLLKQKVILLLNTCTQRLPTIFPTPCPRQRSAAPQLYDNSGSGSQKQMSIECEKRIRKMFAFLIIIFLQFHWIICLINLSICYALLSQHCQ